MQTDSKKQGSISLGSYLKQTIIVVAPLTAVYSYVLSLLMGLDTKRQIILTVINTLVATGLVFLASTRNFKNHVEPLDRIATALKHITSQNDLSGRIVIHAKGGVKELEAHLNRFIDLFHNTLRRISDTTMKLNKSSELFLDISENMAAMSEETSAEINVVGSTTGHIADSMDKAVMTMSDIGDNMAVVAEAVEEMTTSIRSLASASQQTSAGSNQVTDIASVMNQRVYDISASAKDVSGAVNSVATSVKEMNFSLTEVSKNCERSIHITADAGEKAQNTNQIINKLNQSSMQIGKIVGVINDIADQTNMLALNAAIEAAGAGEAGKGFAVVANEVKELAKQTAEATDEISNQIETMQTSTEEAVKAVGVITNVIREITSITGTIASAVTEQSATTGEISKSTIKAAERVTQITRDLDTVSSSMQNVTQALSDASRGVTEIARSAQEISKASNEAASNTEGASAKIQNIIGILKEVHQETGRISRNIEEVGTAAGEIASGASQVSTSAKEMSEEALFLDRFVKQFRI